ncbi:L,D-transpeptidase family protein [Paenibacillus psychroresistens]|uniref:L,D-transpeptidase family protein n=1 Tax=Paenibacillus psychroresistens TaxID=1778678 RepID=UPI0013913260|nr:L,D-transpeptidase family protein [Paenibacillus psychroresistens]
MQNENEEGSLPEARFDNHLKTNLIHLHKNLYLNRTDPLFFEKVLRYADPKSPEAHYMLALKYENEGKSAKALLHYQEAMKDNKSSFYAKAKDRLRRFQRPIPASFPLKPAAPEIPRYSFRKSPLFILMVCNLVLFFLLLNLEPLRAIVSTAMHGKAGLEVVSEIVDTPYIYYIASNEPKDRIETLLYTKAFEMGKRNPDHNIQLYGIKTADAALQGIIAPLTSEQAKLTSFVIAQYNASLDRAVIIKFAETKIPELTTVASNLVRSALQAYLHDNKTPPAQIESLIRDYPSNYLSFIPNEISSGSNQVVDQFDGSGGWVYHPHASGLASMFYPNIVDESTALQPPFSPVKLLISRKEHTLLVVAGSVVLANDPIGVGKDNKTPEGSFTIQDRVLNPLGKHPNVYGKAGLSMGQYAIHGTFDQTSILANKSLGCIRIANSDILALFPFVPKGAEVLISENFPAALLTSLPIDTKKLVPSKKPIINESPPDIVFNWLG